MYVTVDPEADGDLVHGRVDDTPWTYSRSLGVLRIGYAFRPAAETLTSFLESMCLLVVFTRMRGMCVSDRVYGDKLRARLVREGIDPERASEITRSMRLLSRPEPGASNRAQRRAAAKERR